MFIVLQPGPNPPGDGFKIMLEQPEGLSEFCPISTSSRWRVSFILPRNSAVEHWQFPRSPNSSHGSLTYGYGVPQADHPMLVSFPHIFRTCLIAYHARFLPNMSLRQSVFTHLCLHQSRTDVQKVKETRKKRRCVPDAEAESTAGQNAQPEAAVAEPHIVDVCPPCLHFEFPSTQFAPRKSSQLPRTTDISL
jgi:hypothetical protein